MGNPVKIDVAIIGGGISGLWLLHCLRQLGFDALLFEKNHLGQGQTLASQGIIHSGVKYGFDNVVRPQAQSLAAMPKIWMDCIAGNGELDLRKTQILADHQLLFTTGGLKSGIAAAVASKTLRTAVDPIKPADYPDVFRSRGFRGKVFRLPEPVLATKSIISALQSAAAHRAAIKKVIRRGDVIESILFNDAMETCISPAACVFTAGVGNEFFAEEVGLKMEEATQRRPLRMFLAHGSLPALYAHCLVPAPRPRVTITTYPWQEQNVWYIGGDLAEKTVGKSLDESIEMARSEMADIFPNIIWSPVRWAIFDVDRAEPKANKLLPAGATITPVGNSALCWPAKLALAPALAGQVIDWLKGRGVSPSRNSTNLPLPAAEPGQYPWEQVREWIQI